MTRVLLIEDELDLQLTIEAQLSAAGIDVETAGSLDEARATLTAGRFDAILLDLLLGTDSGWSLVDELMMRPGRVTPIIIISAFAAAGTRQRAEAVGCEWLPKPFTVDELKAALQRANVNAPPGN